MVRSCIRWNALPREVGASTAVYARFWLWRNAGFFQRWWKAGLAEFDELVGIDWEWQCLDGVMTKAPFGHTSITEAKGVGHHPTDRGRHGTKWSTLSEGHGLPLAIVVAGANVHDTQLVGATLKAVVRARPDSAQHLYLDAGYVGEKTATVVSDHQYSALMRPRGKDTANAHSLDPTQTPRRHLTRYICSDLHWRRFRPGDLARMLRRSRPLARSFQMR